MQLQVLSDVAAPLGVLALLVTSFVLGAGAALVWRFASTTPVRLLPGGLALAYYAALFYWPHQAQRAFWLGEPYPLADTVRMVIFAVTIASVIGTLGALLARKARA